MIGSYDRVKKAARGVGRARDYVRRMLQKSCLLFEEIDVGVTVILVLVIGGEACMSPENVAQR